MILQWPRNFRSSFKLGFFSWGDDSMNERNFNLKLKELVCLKLKFLTGKFQYLYFYEIIKFKFNNLKSSFKIILKFIYKY